MEFQDSETFFEANDGGIYKTTNGGASWVDLSNGMVISQIYKLGVSQSVKDEVINGLQDNGTKLTSSSNWWDIIGGDGMECIIDYEDVAVQYGSLYYGQIYRTVNRWSGAADITQNIPGGADGAWVTPYLIDPKDNKTLYVGFKDVWKSSNRGTSWIKISNLNLTNKIRSMAIAPASSDVLYLTDHNSFYKTTDGGQTWENITSKLPANTNTITYITVDDLFPEKLWITLGGYDNQKAYESNDGGDTWTDISIGLPTVPANTIIQNKLSKTQQLYAGTDIGVFIKNGDSEWTLFSKNLPSVIVTELEIHYDKDVSAESVLYASTYGRGLWKSNLATFTEPEIKIVDIEGPFIVSNDSTANLGISFTLTETFSGNTFTAYLSDGTGDFSSAIAIGYLESDAAGTIEAIIPTSTLSGVNYRVKVVSSNPELESVVSKPFEIIFDDVPPTITIASTEITSTSAESFDVSISFSEDVVGFEQSDISISNANINSFNNSSPKDYLINISPLQSGVVNIDISADVAYDMLGNWNTASDQWSIYYTITSIERLNEMGISIFPNPTSGLLNIKFKKQHYGLDISVFDLSGRVIYKKILPKSDSYTIDLSHLPKSIYIVKLNVDKEDLVFRLVVE